MQPWRMTNRSIWRLKYGADGIQIRIQCGVCMQRNEWVAMISLTPATVSFIFHSHEKRLTEMEQKRLLKWHLFTVNFLLFWVYGIICSKNMQLLLVRSLFYTWLLSLMREKKYNSTMRWEEKKKFCQKFEIFSWFSVH